MRFFEYFMMGMMAFFMLYTVNINEVIEKINKKIDFLNEIVVNEIFSRSKDND